MRSAECGIKGQFGNAGLEGSRSSAVSVCLSLRAALVGKRTALQICFRQHYRVQELGRQDNLLLALMVAWPCVLLVS